MQMTEKAKKRSASLVFKKMKIKMTLRLYRTPVRMAKIKKKSEKIFTHIAGGCESLYSCYGNQCEDFSGSWVSIYLKIQIYHSGIQPKGFTAYYRDNWSTMFITTLFIRARNWKQPRCPPMDEQVTKMWYIYTIEYY